MSNNPTKPKTDAIQPKRPPGRPTIFTKDLARTIIDRHAAGESIRAICKDPDMPGRATIMRWQDEDRDGFGSILARAHEAYGEACADRAGSHLEISDEELKALDRAASASVQVRKERAAHDRWLASKLSTRYADRTEVHLSGSVDMRGTLGGPLIGQAQIIDAQPAELPEGDDQG